MKCHYALTGEMLPSFHSILPVECFNPASRLFSWSILFAVCGELGSADNSTWTFLCL